MKRTLGNYTAGRNGNFKTKALYKIINLNKKSVLEKNHETTHHVTHPANVINFLSLT